MVALTLFRKVIHLELVAQVAAAQEVERKMEMELLARQILVVAVVVLDTQI